ncbi:MFS transporter [Polynucleobacter sp.]|jgi:ATP-dependent HslUV protease subunit HslV|uniref:MFS transporter n=1 Tax=Polynucleobacter sp. TaxID=2029855 RepID=UPI0037C92FEA
MTTIVAVKTNKNIVIGSDSLLTQGTSKLADTYNLAEKIFVIGNSCIGLSGSTAHYTALIQVLRNMGDACNLDHHDTIFETFTKAHKLLKDEFFLNPKKSADDPYENNHISAMIANGNGIYGVYAHREVLPFNCFWANGSGRPYALGAMHASWGKNTNKNQPGSMSAKDLACAGLAAGIEFDRNSGGKMRLFEFQAGTLAPPTLLDQSVDSIE